MGLEAVCQLKSVVEVKVGFDFPVPQTAGACVLRALPGRGRRRRAARLPVAGAQDGALRAGATAARAGHARHGRAPDAARRRGH